MVEVYVVIGRIRNASGLFYTEIDYYLFANAAINAAHKYVNNLSILSRIDKVIVQKLSIGPQGARIQEIDWINVPNSHQTL